MNITEDYVSFETAKLLKEKGFLKETDLRITQNLSFYDNIGLRHNINRWYDQLIQDKIDFVVAPTQSMAMKWLRKEYGISIEISALNRYHCIYTIYRLLEEKVEELYNDGIYNSYEDATNNALKYCLENLI